MITPNLANRLGATGPIVKYFLTTCSGRREEKSGRRISGVVLRSLTGIMARLPQIFECANIPEDKREIATPEMARQFSHLKEIADEILPYDPKLSVEILIGRDAPELLKIRARRNEPKGAPWAQKLDLGWTPSGQMCLDRVGGPVHISAQRTSLEPSDRLVTSYPRNVKVSHHHAEESVQTISRSKKDMQRKEKSEPTSFNRHPATIWSARRRQTLPENNGNRDSQETTGKLGDAATVSLTYHLDA